MIDAVNDMIKKLKENESIQFNAMDMFQQSILRDIQRKGFIEELIDGKRVAIVHCENLKPKAVYKISPHADVKCSLVVEFDGVTRIY